MDQLEKTIAILLTEYTSGKQIGLIKFDPSGILVYQMIVGGLHPYALKPLQRFLSEELKQPLYEKYAAFLQQNAKLTLQILEEEANTCAGLIASRESGFHVGSFVVTAQVVHM